MSRAEYESIIDINSYLDVFPREHDLLGGLAEQADVPPPRVEVGRVGLHVTVRVSDAVSVKHKLCREGEVACKS